MSQVVIFTKAHIKGYAKKNGTFVAPHEDKRPSAKKARQAWTDLVESADRENAPQATTWKHKFSPGAKFSSGSQSSLFGGHHSAKHYPDAIEHPEPHDDGKPVKINEPSSATDPASWTDAKAVALFTPGSATPPELNGVPLQKWTDHPHTDEGWDYVEGQMDDLDEPPFKAGSKAAAAGVVITEPDGRVWVVRPTNGFAGYDATFPKGHTEPGLSLQATAIKECFEESGLKIQITGFLGDIDRTLTTARYYSAKRVGGTPSAMGWESQAVALVPPEQLHAYLNRTVDRSVASMAGIKAPAGLYESADDWEKVGSQAGSNPGGTFEDRDGRHWYVKLPKSAAVAKNEVLAAKLYDAANLNVPEVKHVTVRGKLGVASRIVKDLKKDPAALKADKGGGIKDGFAVDAWLANWDVVGMGYDNLLVNKEGHGVRIDTGGSMLFRAQGDPKGKAFGPEVGELESLIDGKNPYTTAVFGKIGPKQLKASIARVEKITPETIRALVEEHGPGNAEQRTKLAELLIARRASILRKA